ncbi:MAG: isoleucine--tRNA ligase [Hyphomicrobiaceae bacterium]|nr:isoleucine--tRNA ligase [Hyphomicrobiaceae bacterium]
MTTSETTGRDWSATLYLPKTDFPMKAGLPQLEPRLLARWEKLNLFRRLREASRGRAKFILHDGPPYANGNIHIGTALNKILKDVVTRSQQMLGHDSNYVPGWDCHGLPIEWQIEQEYRAKGRDKDSVPVNEFRRECRAFAQHWIGVQMAEFKRLGVEGDWSHHYSTMDYKAESIIAAEIMKFAMTGALYRGSKPVMWSVVEKTALAEAEVEYHDYQSDTVWVKFRVIRTSTEAESDPAGLLGASIVIWTTTPWTLPGNRAISFSDKIAYGIYEVTASPDGNWARPGDRLVLADRLAEQVMKAAKVDGFRRIGSVSAQDLGAAFCAHPLRVLGYTFPVPLLAGDHVTDEDGTGFVHTAPGHGREDFEIWMANAQNLIRWRIDPAIPFTVDADGRLTKDAPGFEGRQVLTEKGDKGDANDAVIKALIEAGALIARGRLKHQYPHSWRSKKPVIFRNTPQWFIAMDKALPGPAVADWTGAGGTRERTLRNLSLRAIADTEFVPQAGQNRLRGMIEARPDWVISRQRAWGVPITVFSHKQTGEVIPGPQFPRSEELMHRIGSAIASIGADAWFEPGARERFLAGLVADPFMWEPATDILDVWFDSGSTHAFTLEDAQAFPTLAGIRRQRDGGADRVMYLEGSDQHRGWFQSSLLESCGTRGRAPFDVVLTHGFVLDEKGLKMSKSLKNVIAPQEVIKASGADILRLWVTASDYADDLRIGPEIIKTFAETYRKMRNSLRWMLGTLAHYDARQKVSVKAMPELEQLMLHRLWELDGIVRKAYAEYDYKRVVATLSHFMNTDLSAFYFDIRKDALYCDPPSSMKRKAALETIEQIFRATTTWLAPLLCFTAEEAWLSRYPSEDGSVHLEAFAKIPATWRNDDLAEDWEKVKKVRRVVTGALEVERASKKIGSSLEAAPRVFISDDELYAALDGTDFAEVCITSDIAVKEVLEGLIPAEAFTLPDVPGVGVVFAKAEGTRCARSWRFTKDVGEDAAYPELSARDAAAMHEKDKLAAGVDAP